MTVDLDLECGIAIASADRRRPNPRGWLAYVALLGIVVTVAAAYHISRVPGVYYSQVNVVFTAPKSSANPNTLIVGTEGLTIAAGVVAKMIGSQSGVQTASSGVILPSVGVRSGYSVRLPDDGGQYAHNFDKSLLDVQVVDPNPKVVSATMNRLLAEIAADLKTVQDSQHVTQVNRISIVQNPSTPPLYLLTGSRGRALLATLMFGFGITGIVASAIGRRTRAGPREGTR